MRNRFITSSRAVVTMLVFTGGLLAQTAPQPGATTGKAVPRTADGKPDFVGIWRTFPLGASFFDFLTGANAAGGADPGARQAPADPYRTALFGFLPLGPDGRPQEPPLQPWALEKYRLIRSKAPTYRSLADRGPEELDPAMHCLLEGFPRVYTFPRPFEILPPLPDRIVMIFETMNVTRQIYVDRREYFGLLMFIGHSVGRWDGDTLVVDTDHLRGGDEAWLDYLGTPHTTELHVVERIRRPSHDILEIDFTFEDPEAFTRPWEGKKRFYLMPAEMEHEEYMACDTVKALGGIGGSSF